MAAALPEQRRRARVMRRTRAAGQAPSLEIDRGPRRAGAAGGYLFFAAIVRFTNTSKGRK